jgi:glucokinase
VVHLLSAYHPEAIQLTRQAGREVGEIIAIIVNLLNPSVIVIGGSIARAGEDLLAGIKEVVYRRSTPLATQHLRIVPSAGGDLAGVFGAAIMVSQQFFLPASLDTWIASQPQLEEPPPISSLKKQL